MKKRVIIISTVALLLLTIGLTFVYFSGIISGKGEKIVIPAKKVKIIFTDMGKVLSGTIFIEGSAVTLKEGTLATKILRDNDYRNAVERTDFSAIEESSKLWKAEVTENNRAGTTYYFTGNPNNWVSFAGYLWRVIRINEDGSVRLLYAGSGGEDGYIGTSAYNSSYTHPGYVGFKYALGSDLPGTRGTTESTVLTQLNIWYDANLVKKDDGENSYDSYISREAVYCNDRELEPGNSFSTSSEFSYAAAAYGRLYTNKTPTYNCPNEGDRFTGKNLTYPVGLMTADEVSYAGGLHGSINFSAYYYLNKTGGSATGSTRWWTMSPYCWDSGRAHVFRVYGSGDLGYLGDDFVSHTNGVRPVVSLKSCTFVSEGNGAADTPYEVSINESCAALNN